MSMCLCVCDTVRSKYCYIQCVHLVCMALCIQFNCSNRIYLCQINVCKIRMSQYNSRIEQLLLYQLNQGCMALRLSLAVNTITTNIHFNSYCHSRVSHITAYIKSAMTYVCIVNRMNFLQLCGVCVCSSNISDCPIAVSSTKSLAPSNSSLQNMALQQLFLRGHEIVTSMFCNSSPMQSTMSSPSLPSPTDRYVLTPNTSATHISVLVSTRMVVP